MTVDVFGGVLSGGPFAHHMQTRTGINPNAFSLVDPDKPVLVAGNPEWSNEKRVRWDGGIKLHGAMVKSFVV